MAINYTWQILGMIILSMHLHAMEALENGATSSVEKSSSLRHTYHHIPSLCSMALRVYTDAIMERVAWDVDLKNHLLDKKNSCGKDCPLLCDTVGVDILVRAAASFLYKRKNDSAAAYFGSLIHEDAQMQDLFYPQKSDGQSAHEIQAQLSLRKEKIKFLVDQEAEQLIKRGKTGLIQLAHLWRPDFCQNKECSLCLLDKEDARLIAQLAILQATCKNNQRLAFFMTNICTYLPHARFMQEFFMPDDVADYYIIQRLIANLLNSRDKKDIYRHFEAVIEALPDKHHSSNKHWAQEKGVWLLRMAADSHLLTQDEVEILFWRWRTTLSKKIAENAPLQSALLEALNFCTRPRVTFAAESDCYRELRGAVQKGEVALANAWWCTGIVPDGIVKENNRCSDLQDFDLPSAFTFFADICCPDDFVKAVSMPTLESQAYASLARAQDRRLTGLISAFMKALEERKPVQKHIKIFSRYAAQRWYASRQLPLTVIILLAHPCANKKAHAVTRKCSASVLADCLYWYFRHPSTFLFDDEQKNEIANSYLKKLVEHLEEKSGREQESLYRNYCFHYKAYYIAQKYGNKSPDRYWQADKEYLIRGMLAGHDWLGLVNLLPPDSGFFQHRSKLLKGLSSKTVKNIQAVAQAAPSYGERIDSFKLKNVKTVLQWVNDELWYRSLSCLA